MINIDNNERPASSHWNSKLGFIAAAAGSAIGLGNLWKFPYITGANGGGTFVLFYLLCILFFGLPVMIAEVLIGRTAQSSPVQAFGKLSRFNRFWQGIGLLGVLTGVIILSFYSVVGGWALHYLFLALTGGFPNNNDPQVYDDLFTSLYQNPGLNIWWHSIFMLLTTTVILGGVKGGLEKVANSSMVALFIIIILLALYGTTLPGFGEAMSFVFQGEGTFNWHSALEALGHAFFSLSLGMGTMLTYGSYLHRHDDTVSTSISISLADTIISLAACLVVFPITFSASLEAAAGPGLVFVNIPLAMKQLPLGTLVLLVFFFLLVIAALTSAISLLEVVTAFFIDSVGWRRQKAAIICGLFIYFLGVPAAVSGGASWFGQGLQELIGKNWFDLMDYLSSNWLLPIGGLGVSLFMGWGMTSSLRLREFQDGSALGKLTWVYSLWLFLVRWLTPMVITVIMLHALGLF